MTKISVEFETYTFKELSDSSKEKAINDYINFIVEFIPYNELSEDMRKAIDKAEAMHTPWFVGSYIYEYAKDEVIENLEHESFFIDGKLFNNYINGGKK